MNPSETPREKLARLLHAIDGTPEGTKWRVDHSGDGTTSEVTIALIRTDGNKYLTSRVWKVGTASTPEGIASSIASEARQLVDNYRRLVVLAALTGEYERPDELEELFQAPCATAHPDQKEVA